MKSANTLAQQRSHRMMWITPSRVVYVGLLGVPTLRVMGSVNIYVSLTGTIRTRVQGGSWQESTLSVVPPYIPHQVSAEAREIIVLQIESDSVDLSALPAFLSGSGASDNPAFVRHVRDSQRLLVSLDAESSLRPEDFDQRFFGEALVPRRLDPRIATVLALIEQDPSASLSAKSCAGIANLSFSRFLHLFKHEIGISFRKFRTWKRARGLLHYANQTGNLAHIALDIGYADSTHFSHSIRQVFGLRPRDIFAGSRRLTILGQDCGDAATL